MNEKIQKAKEVAIDILKPGAKDLEHGLELHRNLIVCDAYGFAPRAAVDGEAVRAAIEAGASDAEYQDLMEDMSMTRAAVDPGERAEFVEAWDASGVKP